MNVHRKMFNLTLSSAVTAALVLTSTTAVQADGRPCDAARRSRCKVTAYLDS